MLMLLVCAAALSALGWWLIPLASIALVILIGNAPPYEPPRR